MDPNLNTNIEKDELMFNGNDEAGLNCKLNPGLNLNKTLSKCKTKEQMWKQLLGGTDWLFRIGDPNISWKFTHRWDVTKCLPNFECGRVEGDDTSIRKVLGPPAKGAASNFYWDTDYITPHRTIEISSDDHLNDTLNYTFYSLRDLKTDKFHERGRRYH